MTNQEQDDDSDNDSFFQSNKEANDVLQKEIQKLNAETTNKANTPGEDAKDQLMNEDEEMCAKGHDIRVIDPSYNNYSMDYYKSLWGEITCAKVNCKNEGMTMG